jgi:hypothetical protein
MWYFTFFSNAEAHHADAPLAKLSVNNYRVLGSRIWRFAPFLSQLTPARGVTSAGHERHNAATATGRPLGPRRELRPDSSTALAFF